MPGCVETSTDGVNVAGSLGENETGSTLLDSSRNVCADLAGTLAVVGEGAEDSLDRGGVVLSDEARRVHDQSTLDERHLSQVTSVGFVTDGTALQGNDAFEPIAPIGGGDQAEPAVRGSGANTGLEGHRR